MRRSFRSGLTGTCITVLPHSLYDRLDDSQQKRLAAKGFWLGKKRILLVIAAVLGGPALTAPSRQDSLEIWASRTHHSPGRSGAIAKAALSMKTFDHDAIVLRPHSIPAADRRQFGTSRKLSARMSTLHHTPLSIPSFCHDDRMPIIRYSRASG